MRLRALVIGAALLASWPARASSSEAITAAVLVALPVGLAVYDVALAASGEPTVSMAVRDVSWKANVVPYLGGVLAAHLFLNVKDPPRDRWAFGLATVPVVVVYDLICRDSGRVWWRHPGIAFGAGVAVGALTWTQRF